MRVARYRGGWLDVPDLWGLLAVNDTALVNARTCLLGGVIVAPSSVVNDDAQLVAGFIIHPPATRSSIIIGENARIGPSVVVDNSLVVKDTALEHNAVVTDCVVSANSIISGGAATAMLNVAVYHDIHYGEPVTDKVTSGTSTTVQPRAIVGNDSTIEALAG